MVEDFFISILTYLLKIIMLEIISFQIINFLTLENLMSNIHIYVHPHIIFFWTGLTLSIFYFIYLNKPIFWIYLNLSLFLDLLPSHYTHKRSLPYFFSVSMKIASYLILSLTVIKKTLYPFSTSIKGLCDKVILTQYPNA